MYYLWWVLFISTLAARPSSPNKQNEDLELLYSRFLLPESNTVFLLVIWSLWWQIPHWPLKWPALSLDPFSLHTSKSRVLANVKLLLVVLLLSPASSLCLIFPRTLSEHGPDLIYFFFSVCMMVAVVEPGPYINKASLYH